MTLLITLWIWSMPQAAAQPSAPRPDLLEQIACAPIGLPAPPLTSMRVIGGYLQGRSMFGPGDALILSAGTAHGVQKGQQYFVRRPVIDGAVKQPKVGGLYGAHTAGWITVVDVKDDLAVAKVTHSCDGILEGDYLDPYVPPAVPPASLTGEPDYAHPGHIVMADELRQTGSAGMFMLMNRGVDDGVRAGQILTIYRETLGGEGPILDVGRATVFTPSAKSSLVRIDSSRDAVYIGDRVAIHRIAR